ncbi:hypothetical protein J2739_000765 [Variovorax soli]|uniref:Uncharacterized protein n=1 Tax=Variovorax soli TaxID=376815 RepID=A0ABU1NAA8_9BURK|nr:hypothetical protein [Variovorax soli]
MKSRVGTGHTPGTIRIHLQDAGRARPCMSHACPGAFGFIGAFRRFFPEYLA